VAGAATTAAAAAAAVSGAFQQLANTEGVASAQDALAIAAAANAFKSPEVYAELVKLVVGRCRLTP